MVLIVDLCAAVSFVDAVGEFGWFYGDFFVSPDAYKPQLCYTGVHRRSCIVSIVVTTPRACLSCTGIYRFLNNPDCITGSARLWALQLALCHVRRAHTFRCTSDQIP